ncbi:helicase-exonuclease AddAB subunit AddA [Clostridium saccharobutylicum]|uniref:ATP-dependent helicase/nuclease subunit A n=1 Tax=Clostridium saccharobutylicum DSM 13864 TaxID=1345695 RepID=U5MKP2_CLOSA|nr:helicase-exonuclease AddAB subunit AddA [Clostridium saccharobutylicum]AGX41098.1 ATP-dependent helicase/nuclease subunit A [Clostridium saccharobutylicum DSM 13864]AQR88384.1 ATP-dependent helicase/nuclease subunit A [Clostridium saccharobutylicum]AQR98282.1 ATP-dependent helicase/nuclease subunit A [Clostridium saccharobutylicum]AQS07976.1 ATP-dependent helicase/nuclease subunit A [Clostridium saccharobutylicum]AQS12272.1 ATP-dependent helicase/nuclease subunit A [Clostridium saccharobuty
MGETKWTDEQLSAIETRNCNLLVAAAAGSGKTAVLVERIIRIITNEEAPVDIDKLLVVTFTNAAAAEMRERIAIAISKELDKNPNSKNLQKQLTLLNRANITTMHSFCLDVIKSNFHKIDLDPSFRIGDQTEGTLIKAEVIEELFEDKYDEDDADFINLVEVFGNYKNDDNLKDLVLDLYDFTMSGPWPERWLIDSAEEFNIKTLEELNNSKWVKVLNESVSVEIQGYINSMEKAIEIINSTDGLEPYLDSFISELSQIKSIYENINNGLEKMYIGILSINFGKLKPIKKDKVSDQNAQNLVKNIRDDIKKRISSLVNNIFSVTPDDMLINIQGSYPYIKKLSEIVLEFGERFSKKKKERNILDFNDLEHLCLKILIEYDENKNLIPSKVAENFKNYFDEVLVDEYQDSNSVQETIIGLVSRRDSDIPNVFMVGDVKQSIYRFRQAKPELFIEKYNNYQTNIGINRKIQLYKNFRSRKEIIDGVNYIFKEVMSQTVGELEYTDDEALNLGANYKEFDDDNITLGGAIEVNIVDKNGKNIEEDIEDEQEEIEAVNLEGRIIAKRINELMSSKAEKVFKVLDKETGEYRPLRYKDIVILLRATKNWSENLLEELGKEGIPVYADTGSGYFESIEIRTIISLLKVIDNPMQDIPMIALLRSPIMNFSAEELSDIRLVNKEKYFYENIKYIVDESSKENGYLYSEEIVDKCVYLLQCIDKWRKKSIYMAIDEFIWYLYMDTAYYGYVGAMPNGMLRQANLKILFQRARQFEQTSFKGLFNFISFINKLTKSSGDMGSAKILGENEDVVRIMSIHKSKGLEFPVVFLCGTGKQFNLMDLNKNILYHDELGIGPDFVDINKRFSIGTLAKEAIKKKIKLETLSEEMRILYVAYTRAKEKLIITGAVNNIDKIIEKWMNSASLEHNLILPSEVMKGKSYLDWIGMALCQHNDGAVLREKISESNEISKVDASRWEVKLWNKADLINMDDLNDETEKGKLESNVINNNSLNESTLKSIDEILSYEYPLKESTIIKSNISVSDLKRRNLERNLEIEEMYREKVMVTPKFLQEEKGLTSSERGTAVHFVMRKLDLNRVSTINEIKDQLKELYEGEFLLEAEVKAINPYKILNFFKCNLGSMMIELHKKGEKVYREIPFYTEISSLEINNDLDKRYNDETVRLQGIIDCFFEYRKEIILLDYKTDYIEKGKENEFKEKYKKQIDYYSDAIVKMTGKKVKKKYLYSFYLEEEIQL